MRNKIITTLGILIVIFALGAYFLFDTNIRQNSNSMGYDILVAKTNIADGTVVKDINQADALFEAKRVNQADIVPSAEKVTTQKVIRQNSLLNSIKDFFSPSSYGLSAESYKALVGKKIVGNVYKNQQVLSIMLSNDSMELKDNEKYYAVSTDYISSVGAEIKKGDYVDLWIHYTDKQEKAGLSEKIIGPLKVIKIKDENNAEITNASTNKIPKLVIFKMNEEQIALISQKSYEGSLFLTKWGVSPNSKAQLDSPDVSANSSKTVDLVPQNGTSK